MLYQLAYTNKNVAKNVFGITNTQCAPVKEIRWKIDWNLENRVLLWQKGCDGRELNWLRWK